MTDTSDLTLFSSADLTFDESTWGPRTCRGADKIGQRVLYALMTPQGSVPGRENDGSPFLTLVDGFRSEFDVFTAWAASEAAVKASVQAAELTTDSDSDRLGSVQIGSVSVVAGAVTLTMVVTALDGSKPTTSVEFVLPS